MNENMAKFVRMNSLAIELGAEGCYKELERMTKANDPDSSMFKEASFFVRYSTGPRKFKDVLEETK